MKKTKEAKKNHGITLIALAITIIVLLILAGVTVATLTGDNGIIKNSKDAKEQTEISEEKEVVDRATVQAMGNNKRGDLIESELQDQLDKIVSSGKTEVTDTGEEFEILFKESNRYYTVDKDGNVVEQEKLIVDKAPGDITKDENGKELKGDESEPYEIWCIEDLVEWSENYKEYQKFNIILGKNLDFKSYYSYTNGKMLGCNSIEELKELLTSTEGTGFTPISDFSSTFNGQGHVIKNIYINTTGDAGLFLTATGKIENLNISGNITSTENSAGGIIASSAAGVLDLEICKCINKANVNSLKAAGGIVGYGNVKKLTNCYNYGEIYSYGMDRGKIDYATGSAGGIVGSKCENIQECGNEGKVSSAISAGGIIGFKYMNFNAVNCYNIGEINGETYSGRNNRRKYSRNSKYL